MHQFLILRKTLTMLALLTTLPACSYLPHMTEDGLSFAGPQVRKSNYGYALETAISDTKPGATYVSVNVDDDRRVMAGVNWRLNF